MAEQPDPKGSPDNAGELRNKLIKRLAVAGGLVAVLLGVLAFFDYLSTPPEEPEEEVYTKPVPVPPKKPVSQPVTPTTDLPEPPRPAPAVTEAPPPPQVAAQPPAAPAKPEGKTEARVPTPAPQPVQVPTPPVAAPQLKPSPAVPVAPEVRAPRPVPEVSAPPVVVLPPEAAVPPAKAPARVLESRPVPVAEPSGVARLFSGFLLQAGVFTSPQRAEELHARLTLSGVPSTLETRVQVGPFRTRHEAEAAQVKLRELGIETVLVPPRAKH